MKQTILKTTVGLFLSILTVLLFWKLEQYVPMGRLAQLCSGFFISALTVVLVWLKIWRQKNCKPETKTIIKTTVGLPFAIFLFWKVQQYVPVIGLLLVFSGYFFSAFVVVLVWLKIWRGNCKPETKSFWGNVGKFLFSILVVMGYYDFEEIYPWSSEDFVVAYPVFIMFLLRVACCIVITYIWVPSIFGKYRHLMLIACFLPYFVNFYVLDDIEVPDTSASDEVNDPIVDHFCRKYLQFEGFFTPLPESCRERLGRQ